MNTPHEGMGTLSVKRTLVCPCADGRGKIAQDL
jgi:hypothetical protein